LTPSDSDLALYRPGVGLVLINRDGLLFAGRRIDMMPDMEAWQMPQGGIDPGETPRQAALRELREEVGTDKAVILAESRDWHAYDVPGASVARLWGGGYRGQRQKWFALRFTGRDEDINLATEHPEFDAWQWLAPARLSELIVPFKRDIYRAVFAEFAPLLTA
jgi:putative (di)nucleoside polyphosphate hydrolase